MQVYLGLGRAPERGAGASPWQLGDVLGADEDDGGFMEASPIDRAPGDEDGANTYTAGQESLARLSPDPSKIDSTQATQCLLQLQCGGNHDW